MISIFVNGKLTCDKCGKTAIYESDSKMEILKMARADGWHILREVICSNCKEPENEGC